MSLTRAFLKSLALNDEQISAIIEAHTETVDGLKAINTETLAKLDTANAELTKVTGENWEQKYTELSNNFEAYKNEQTAKEARAVKENAYRALLREAGVSEKRIDGIVKYDSPKIDTIELNDDGTVKDKENFSGAIKSDWADFITEVKTSPAPAATPPAQEPQSAIDADWYNGT